MARRGPKPLDVNPATPARGIPDPPKGLTPAERRHWRETAAHIEVSGLLSLVDHDALAIYVTLWSRWRDALAQIPRTGGMVVKASNGIVIQNPWLKIAVDAEKEMAKYLDMFGLSPKARRKLAVQEPEEPDAKWERFD